jgi:hypothetical protein
MKPLLLSLLLVVACRDDASPSGGPVASAADLHGTFVHDGECAGSPENPGCDSTLELGAGGRGSFIGDDIIEPITWRLDGQVVEVSFEVRAMTFDVVDSDQLVERAAGTVWRRR